MKILFYEPFSGISGDMNLGAMISLGVDPEYLRNSLNKLNLNNKYSLDIKKEKKMGISGIRVVVNVFEGKRKKHSHRHLNDIKKLIDESTLSPAVKSMSFKIFMKVAKAEGKVHGKSFDEVHFHEVGAVDSIIDIVGSAICFEYLGITKAISLPPELGSGFVKCAHGNFPVPAPATSEILKGYETKYGTVEGEATTPTGAAILTTLCDRFEKNVSLKITQTGFGIGEKDFEHPNVLRVSIAESNDERRFLKKQQVLIETNIDDMNPEFLPLIERKLLSLNALDVYKTPIVMKKGRLATKLTILTEDSEKNSIIEFLFRNTSTLGIRVMNTEKYELHRDSVKVTTKYGDISVKRGILDGKIIKTKPEYDDLLKISEESSIDILKLNEITIKKGLSR